MLPAGACWGQDLTCLVLEWVPKGTLGDLLGNQGLDLSWSEPLLRLATDVARGLCYLHGRSFFDEVEKKHKECVIHRDLKVPTTSARSRLFLSATQLNMCARRVFVGKHSRTTFS